MPPPESAGIKSWSHQFLSCSPFQDFHRHGCPMSVFVLCLSSLVSPTHSPFVADRYVFWAFTLHFCLIFFPTPFDVSAGPMVTHNLHSPPRCRLGVHPVHRLTTALAPWTCTQLDYCMGRYGQPTTFTHTLWTSSSTTTYFYIWPTIVTTHTRTF